MAIQFDAVYEGGVLKPLRPLNLAENQQVVVVVKEATDESDIEAMQKAEFMENLRKELAGYSGPTPTLEEVRRIMSRIPGSLSDELIASRGEH